MKWCRGGEKINFNRPHVWLALGGRGEGKSSLIEHIGEEYLREGAGLFDLFGSRDGEGLAWLRSPWAQDKKIMLLCDNNVDVKSSFPVKHIKEVLLSDFEKFDIVVNPSPFYSSMTDEFVQSAKLLDILYRRLHYRKLIFVVCREASNLFYSRLRVSESQVLSKAEMVYTIRESRHNGLSLGLDTLRSLSIDVDVRNLADFTLFKAVGGQGLTRDLEWLYKFVNPYYLATIPKNRFIMLTRKGSIGEGSFPEVAWHKREGEDMMGQLGISVEYHEKIDYGKDKGTFKTVSDFEHVVIVKAYASGKGGYVKVGHEVGRSSRTVQVQVKAHNTAIEKTGKCPRCHRVKEAELAQALV